MKTIFGIRNLPRNKRIVLAIGVFDGLHYAHRKILKKVVLQARRIKGKSVVLTFFPHPQKEETLYSLRHRLKLLEVIGIDICIVVNFNSRFAKVSAQDFVKEEVVKKIHPDYIFIGGNFRFGKNAKGNVDLLAEFAARYNFKLEVFEVMRVMGKPVSSTHIRNLIKKGKINTAKKLLARRVSVLGTVVPGASLARKLGFPTANINPHHEIIPPAGVYLVDVILNKGKFKGLCYIGSRPTFKNKPFSLRGRTIKERRNIEVYIFNFTRNIYGQDLEIQFIRKLRNEKKFASVKLLVSGIQKDLVKAKKSFSLHNS